METVVSDCCCIGRDKWLMRWCVKWASFCIRLPSTTESQSVECLWPLRRIHKAAATRSDEPANYLLLYFPILKYNVLPTCQNVVVGSFFPSFSFFFVSFCFLVIVIFVCSKYIFYFLFSVIGI